MAKNDGRGRARTVAEVARYNWVRDCEVQVAGCISVAVGPSSAAVAGAFGIDLDAPLHAEDDHEGEDRDRLASVVTRDAATVVVEDNGFEGSREVVLKAASRGGRAASVFWNVNDMVVVSCASRGRVVFTGEIDFLEDPDEREGLPRGLDRFVDLAVDGDVDVAAVGAAMVAAYVGVPFGPDVVDGRWRAVEPVVEEPPLVTPESWYAGQDHPDLLRALMSVPGSERRPLVALVLRVAAERAALADDPTVAEVLGSLGDGDGAGTVTPRLEDFQRRSERVMDVHTDRLNFDDDLDMVEWQEENGPIARTYWLGKALRYGCATNDVSALLGVVDCTATICSTDELDDAFRNRLTEACAVPASERATVLARLGPAPSPEDRARSAAARRHSRALAEADEHDRREVAAWNGIRPSPRMRRAEWAALLLAETHPVLLVALDRLPDAVVREVAVWSARELLDVTGLLDRPWLAAHVTRMHEPDAHASEVHDDLFAQLDNDDDVPWSSHRRPDGGLVSEQHFALPVVYGVRAVDAFEAACNVLRTAVEAVGPRFDGLARRLVEQFELDLEPQ